MAKRFDGLHIRPLDEIVSESFGKYAKYIIQDRALPDVRDGLKPVQRRIIYAMNELQLFCDKPHKKSARVVGEVIGKYHPHGDTSIYDAMVRMSQGWKNNCPIIDMHGNNGSIDGDSAAAMRYTECRLSNYGQTMATGMHKNVVKFINNFDDSETEPVVLPTILPNLLINGATGIAAGYATNIPPFNACEVIDAIITRIDSPTCYLSSILKVMPGPDLPTGGIIVQPEGIKQAYETGRGKFVLRAKIIQESAKKIYISEIPYDTNKANILKEIQQVADKHDVLGITEIRDESDGNGVSIAIETKNGKTFELLKSLLYKNTSLQISYNINAVCIRDRKPCCLGMLAMLDAFIEHINNIVVSASKYDLKAAENRKEVVTGLIKAIKIVDDVVTLIRRASDKASAKQALINRLAFTEIQAEAVVNLRLYRLSSTDVTALNTELEQLTKLIVELKLLIENKEHRNNHIKSALRGFKKTFPMPRKTTITNEQAKIEIDIEDVIEDREVIVLVTRDGYLKNISKRSYGSSEYNSLKLKEYDIPVAQFISNQRDKIVMVGSKGEYISIPTHKVPENKWAEMGIHINNVVVNDPTNKIVNAFSFNNVEDQRTLIIATKKGMIKRTLVKDLGVTKITKSSTIMPLDDGDEIVSCVIDEQNNESNYIGVVTKHGIAVRYPVNQVSIVSRNAAGVKSIGLKDNDEVAAVFLQDARKDFVLIASQQGMKRIRYDAITIGSRPNVGKPILAQIKSSPIIVLSVFPVNMNDTINVITEEKKWLMIKCSEIVIGDQDTRVSAIDKHQTTLVSLAPNESNNSLFD